MKPVRFAVVGFGRIGQHHCELISHHQNQDYGVPFYTSLEALFGADLTFDVINICTPNGYHTEQAIEALSNRYHVVCEKPMGLHRADCEKVINKSLQVAKHVFCVMQNRYSPPSQWLKEVIEKRLLGKIYLVDVNCYWNRDERYYDKHSWKGTLKLDGGPLFTQFSHFVDLVYWLFGDIQNISTNFMNYNHQNSTEFEDTGLITFNFSTEGIGAFHYTTAVPGGNLESSMTIIGENGSIKVGGQYMEKVEICRIEGYEMPELSYTNPPNEYGTYKGSAANHVYVIENVISTIKGEDSATTNALEGLKVVDIIERIYSYR